MSAKKPNPMNVQKGSKPAMSSFNRSRNLEHVPDERNTIQMAMSRYKFLYNTLYVPMLKQICAYLDKFTIGYYTKGPHKNSRYVTLPRPDILPFNKLLDDAAVCFRHLNQLTSCRSHAAQYIADKLKLLGTDDQFCQLFRRRNPTAIVYITSDMEYVGCSISAYNRRWQHIHNLMRHYLDVQRSGLPIYAKTRTQGKMAMAKLCVMIPFEITSSLCKFTDEARSIRILCPPKNVQPGLFCYSNLRPKRRGSHHRARLRGGERYIPSVPKSTRIDKTLFEINAHTEGQREPMEIISTRLEDIAKVWYQHGTFSVSPGRFDNSGWSALLSAFRGSLFQRLDTRQHLTLEDLQRSCSTSSTDYGITTFIVKIIFLARNTFYMKNETSLINIRARLRLLPIPQQQIEIYRMQYAMEFEPTNMKDKRKNLLKLLCRQMQLKMLRQQYFFPVHYHHHLDMKKVHRCIRMVIDKLDVPKDIKTYIEWLTKVVKKKTMFSIKPKYLNSKRYIDTFSETPWAHCEECVQPNNFWTNTPRQLVPTTNHTRCISTFPAQHPPLHSKCRALQLSCSTPAFQFGSKTWKVAKLGLVSFINSLPKELVVDNDTIESLGRFCVMNRMDRNKANKRMAIITSMDINLATKTLENFYVEPFDKNKGEVYIACPFMAWHLIKKTYDWMGDNPQYELVTDKTPDMIIQDMFVSWGRLCRRLKSKLPPLLQDGRLGIATAYQKYGKPEPKKRPVIDLKFDTAINIRKAVARAGIFCINHIIGNGSFHLPHSMGLRERLNKIQDYFNILIRRRNIQDPILVIRSDDIEGFFTNVDVDAAIAAHERIIELYLIQFANKYRVGKRRFQATSRNSNKIYVPLAKTIKPQPGHYNTAKLPGRYSTVKLQEMTKIIQWTTQYRTFTLGTLTLKQKSGLFQGCPLSVYLALSIAFISEHDARLSTMGRTVQGLRYVDDKLGITVSENNPEAIAVAHEILKEYNDIYHPSLTVKEEPPVLITPTETKYIYIGHIITNSGTKIIREYYNKNWHSYDRRFPFRQVYKLEQHYGSYCDATAIRGQRMGRLMAIMRSTDIEKLRQVLCEKLFEYTNGLGDPPSFTIRLLRRLLRISTNHPEQCRIIIEILGAYRQITKNTRWQDRNIFNLLPNLNTGSILG